MSGLTATLILESSRLPLTKTLEDDATATVQPIAGTGTVPNIGAHLFTVKTGDFERFEAALTRDDTIDSFERVVEMEGEAVYRFEYASDATVFSAAIAEVRGISLDWTNDGTAWTVRVWLPDREALASLWEFARDHDVEFTLGRVYDYTSPDESGTDLTRDQKNAILRALKMGYFEEPREATLDEVAAELGVSQPAAGGLIRRGLKRLVVSSLADDADIPDSDW